MGMGSGRVSRYAVLRARATQCVLQDRPAPNELVAELLDALNNCETALLLCEGNAKSEADLKKAPRYATPLGHPCENGEQERPAAPHRFGGPL